MTERDTIAEWTPTVGDHVRWVGKPGILLTLKKEVMLGSWRCVDDLGTQYYANIEHLTKEEDE